VGTYRASGAIDLDRGGLMAGVVGEASVPAVIVGMVEIGDGSP
jgi:hypothetical protein